MESKYQNNKHIKIRLNAVRAFVFRMGEFLVISTNVKWKETQQQQKVENLNY